MNPSPSLAPDTLSVQSALGASAFNTSSGSLPFLKNSAFLLDHHLHSQQRLQAISQVTCWLDEAGVHLNFAGCDRYLANYWPPEEIHAQQFAQLPAAFARTYLAVRLRDFLSETFCEPEDELRALEIGVLETQPVSKTSAEPQEAATLANDRVGGGLHTGLLNLFPLHNHGQGYFDPGWQVVDATVGDLPNDSLIVQKYGVQVHIGRSRHLQPSQQVAQPGDTVAVWLPGYRFESGCYVAIGNAGPASLDSPAVEIYFAANPAAMVIILETVTCLFNRQAMTIPFTLTVPTALEDYCGPETVVLRVEAAACDQVMTVVSQLYQQIHAASGSVPGPILGEPARPQFGSATAAVFAAPPQLRSHWPCFAQPLAPGIGLAAVIESPLTYWFASRVDLSRLQLMADALVDHWLETPCLSQALAPDKPVPKGRDLAGDLAQAVPEDSLSAIAAHFREAQLDWHRPWRRLDTPDGWFKYGEG